MFCRLLFVLLYCLSFFDLVYEEQYYIMFRNNMKSVFFVILLFIVA
jgi:hypothetical protein